MVNQICGVILYECSIGQSKVFDRMHLVFLPFMVFHDLSNHWHAGGGTIFS